MPIKFYQVCELFEKLSHPDTKSGLKCDNTIVQTWFQKYDCDIVRRGSSGLALLSCLFPEKRADRVYGLQEKRLGCIIQKALGLGHTRMDELQRWQDTDGLDLASAVQRVVSATDETLKGCGQVTVEEIDHTLDLVASTCSFSSIKIQTEARHLYVDATDELTKIFRRQHSSEVKWMIRLLLKDLRLVEMPEMSTLQRFHFLLPDLLKVRNSLAAALKMLDGDLISQMPAWPAQDVERQLKESASAEIKPQVGTMISQSLYDKGRNIKHCCNLVGKNKASIERKYDGEYCQIHVSKNADSHVIKIFSKSGRDSTRDRLALHDTISKCLGIGTSQCKFDRYCILEGEILVWNDRIQQIMPFHKIRKHVQREGRYLGCAQDSPQSKDEHLMVMFYDLLLLDDFVCIHETHDQRRRRLWSTVHRIPGRADIGTREKINFGLPDASTCLREAMASAITQGWEGLVLKVCNDPYLSLHENVRQIKLKKDYIPGLGDSADLVVVGGRRDAKDVQALRMGNLSWTTFYLACLENKDQVRRFDVKPSFRIVCTVARPSLSERDLGHLNRYGKLHQIPFARRRAEMDIQIDLALAHQPTELFKEPAVVEVIGAGFDKPANASIFTLRFPRIQKIHKDRPFQDALGFVEYQRLAEQSRGLTKDNDGDLREPWLMKLREKDYGVGRRRDSSTSDESTQSTERTASSKTESVPSTAVSQLDDDNPSCHQNTHDHSSGKLRRATSISNRNHSLKRNISLERASGPSTGRKKARRTEDTIPMVEEGSSLHDVPVIATKEIAQARTEQGYAPSKPNDTSRGKPDKTNPSTIQMSVSEINQEWSFSTKHFATPVLLDKSLSSLFANPDQSLMDLCSQASILVTFNANLFFDQGRCDVPGRTVTASPDLFLHVVLVHWTHANVALSGARSLLSAWEVEKGPRLELEERKILFLDWKVLELLDKDDDLLSKSSQELVKTYMVYKGGMVKRFTYGIFTWQQVLDFLT